MGDDIFASPASWQRNKRYSKYSAGTPYSPYSDLPTQHYQPQINEYGALAKPNEYLRTYSQTKKRGCQRYR